jgi:hypothetical protein
MSYTVTVHCRQRGAIGIFENRRFTLTAPDNATRADILDAWERDFSDSWELHHIACWEMTGDH